MVRLLRLLLVSGGLLSSLSVLAVAQGLRGEVITEPLAARHGLSRAWVSQIQMDRSRDRLHSVTQHNGTLMALTDQGSLHVIDAETGRSLWVLQIGSRRYPTLPATTNGRQLAAINGDRLYLMDLTDGEAAWDARLASAPSAPPLMSDQFVYVPMFNGLMVAYDLNDGRRPAWQYRGASRSDSRPLLTHHRLIWSTAGGLVYGSRHNRLDIQFRYETQGPVLCTPGYQPPRVFIVSQDRYVYCIEEQRGSTLAFFDRHSEQNPVPIDDSLYVVADGSGMFSLSVEQGLEQWFAPDITQFMAASPTRVYAADRLGRTVVLSRQSGTRLDSFPTEMLPLKLQNEQTDRIFLGTHTGLLQCLHEQGLDHPVIHREMIKPIDDEAEEAASLSPGIAMRLLGRRL